MKLKYLLETEIPLSREERNAFVESIRQYSGFKDEIYRSTKLKELSQKIGQMVEATEAFALQETDGWFDNVSVNRDLKELKNDYKVFEKTCEEMSVLQQRLEAVYENMGVKLLISADRYKKVKQ